MKAYYYHPSEERQIVLLNENLTPSLNALQLKRVKNKTARSKRYFVYKLAG